MNTHPTRIKTEKEKNLVLTLPGIEPLQFLQSVHLVRYAAPPGSPTRHRRGTAFLSFLNYQETYNS